MSVKAGEWWPSAGDRPEVAPSGELEARVSISSVEACPSCSTSSAIGFNVRGPSNSPVNPGICSLRGNTSAFPLRAVPNAPLLLALGGWIVAALTDGCVHRYARARSTRHGGVGMGGAWVALTGCARARLRWARAYSRSQDQHGARVDGSPSTALVGTTVRPNARGMPAPVTRQSVNASSRPAWTAPSLFVTACSLITPSPRPCHFSSYCLSISSVLKHEQRPLEGGGCGVLARRRRRRAPGPGPRRTGRVLLTVGVSHDAGGRPPDDAGLASPTPASRNRQSFTQRPCGPFESLAGGSDVPLLVCTYQSKRALLGLALRRRPTVQDHQVRLRVP